MPKVRVSTTLSVEQLRAQQSEAQLLNDVTRLARMLGWWTYHTHDSRHSERGFPDLVLLHPESRRCLFRELKTDTGKVRPEQDRLLVLLRACGIDAEIWRPWMWPRIEAELRGEP